MQQDAKSEGTNQNFKIRQKKQRNKPCMEQNEVDKYMMR